MLDVVRSMLSDVILTDVSAEVPSVAQVESPNQAPPKSEPKWAVKAFPSAAATGSALLHWERLRSLGHCKQRPQPMRDWQRRARCLTGRRPGMAQVLLAA